MKYRIYVVEDDDSIRGLYEMAFEIGRAHV